MHVLQTEIEQRWGRMFAALVGGDDVPPATRLRTEGLMEAVVLSGVATQDDVLAAMDRCYREAYGYSIEQAFGDDWRVFFPFPQIPAMGRRAPVYPSTKD